jgi:hypothetical protein
LHDVASAVIFSLSMSTGLPVSLSFFMHKISSFLQLILFDANEVM